MLLIRLRHAADNSPTYESQEESRPVDTAHGTEVTFHSRDQPKKAFARVSLWVEATESWEPFDAEQSEASLHVRPGSLEILQRASKFIWRLNLTSNSIIKQQSSVEILVDRVTTAGDEDAGLGHWKRIMLKCRSKTERNDLLASLQYAVDSSGRPSTPPQATSGSQHTLRDDQEALNPRWTIPPRSQWTKQSVELNLSSVPTEGPSSASEQLRAATMDSNRTQKPTPSKPSASSASRDSLARLIDPTLIPLEELNIENYFEHEAPPALGIFPSTDTIFDDAEASAQRKITTVYTAPFTNIDKRLVHKSILEKYGLEFNERNECFHVFKVVEKEEVLRLHEETRNTPRFLGRAYDPDSN
ncbi:hypothetical protein SLS60_003199 [Paraconiothyrium brasiliense]|uniref:DUF8035 domain-containing protein n=1 Tax=Paraconiothyrium brasiliense TaxID=300254 RepID=A0ABR3RV12_9PLEO